MDVSGRFEQSVHRTTDAERVDQLAEELAAVARWGRGPDGLPGRLQAYRRWRGAAVHAASGNGAEKASNAAGEPDGP
jgi:hypothetical protein